MRFLAALLAVALVLPVLHAGGSTPGGSNDYLDVCGVQSFDVNGGMEFISIAFAIVSFSIGLAYMYSKLKEDPKIGVWAKDEAYNLLISVLMFAGLIVFFTGSCRIAQAFSGDNPFAAADNYIAGLSNSNGMGLLQDLTRDSLEDQKKATAYLYIGMAPFTGSGAAEDAHWKAFSAHKEMVIDLYLPMIASLNAQRYILQAIQWVGAGILLPFAFIMRLIPPTREFGNVLIAIFFGLYIVVPTLYVMSAQAYSEVLKNPVVISDPPANNFYSYGIEDGYNTFQSARFYRIGSTIPQAVFIPNLVIIVTITCITSLSKALRAMAA